MILVFNHEPVCGSYNLILPEWLSETTKNEVQEYKVVVESIPRQAGTSYGLIEVRLVPLGVLEKFPFEEHTMKMSVLLKVPSFQHEKYPDKWFYADFYKHHVIGN